jgi:hypothetical protein
VAFLAIVANEYELMTSYSFNATKSPRPSRTPKHGSSRDEQIDQWTAEAAVTAEPVDAFEDLTSLVPQYLGLITSTC